MNIIVPITVTESMLQVGTTLAEPASGETEWVSGGTYDIEVSRIRTTTHRSYRSVQAHTGRTALPENDPAFWKDEGPSLRHAAFDAYSSTTAKATGTLTYVLQPGFFNSIYIIKPIGLMISIVVKDSPGGTVTFSRELDVYEQALGYYELCYRPLRTRSKLLFTDIGISPNAELTVTITAPDDGEVAIGTLGLGDFTQVFGDGDWGGTEYGASAKPKTFSYIKFFDDGTFEIVKRGSAVDLSGNVAMPASAANAAAELVRSVLGTPIFMACSTDPAYEYLNTVGLLEGDVTADNFGKTSFKFSATGTI